MTSTQMTLEELNLLEASKNDFANPNDDATSSTTIRKSLRICCYGSSSASTPKDYIQEARLVGYYLAKRGHTIVNGAGSYGCMAAMNDGAYIGNGTIIGVIHEMFLVDGGIDIVRDGGAHNIFSKENMQIANNESKGKREILIAGGNDLQQRKKLLVGGADALIVLPGGPGTWDEVRKRKGFFLFCLVGWLLM